MPLLDHFRPPTFEAAPWTSIGAFWMVNVARYLNRTLPDAGYRAFVRVHLGNMAEADIGEFERDVDGESGWGGFDPTAGDGGTMTAVLPPPVGTVTPVIPDDFEIVIETRRAGLRLVAVLEFISPSNKDRAEARRKLVDKCRGYLALNVGVVLIDTVTCRHANLSNELVAALGTGGPMLTDCATYVSAFRPAARDEAPRVDVWPYAAPVGQRIPSVPLPIPNGPPLMIDLESTYTEACADHGL